MVFCCKKCWCSYREPTAYLCIPFVYSSEIHHSQAILQISFVTYCMSTALVIPIIKNIFLQAIILITFYTILFLILWSYIQCIFTEPGIVNKDIVRILFWVHVQLQKIEEKDPDVSTYHYCKFKTLNINNHVESAINSNHIMLIIADVVEYVY